MARVGLHQPSFAAGELSPRLFGRVDLQKYFSGAEVIENFIVRPEGGRADNDQGVFVPDSFSRQGSVAVFSTLLKHRVTPIKAGERRSLTAWFKGPPFR